MLSRRAQEGIAVLAFVTTMLVLTASVCAAAMHFLHAGRQLAGLQLDREIAFRAAEAALLDAEADLLAAAASPHARLASWPDPGHCGVEAQRAICRTGTGQPAWWPWIEGSPPESVPALSIGAFTGARLPDLPEGVAGATHPPRYLIEVLDHHQTLQTLAGTAQWPRFRITALGLGRDPSVRVLLQTEFQP